MPSLLSSTSPGSEVSRWTPMPSSATRTVSRIVGGCVGTLTGPPAVREERRKQAERGHPGEVGEAGPPQQPGVAGHGDRLHEEVGAAGLDAVGDRRGVRRAAPRRRSRTTSCSCRRDRSDRLVGPVMRSVAVRVDHVVVPAEQDLADQDRGEHQPDLLVVAAGHRGGSGQDRRGEQRLTGVTGPEQRDGQKALELETPALAGNWASGGLGRHALKYRPRARRGTRNAAQAFRKSRRVP